jgi:hypothetical protein
MNNKTGGNRSPRRARAVAVMAAVAMLTAGCGFVHVQFEVGSPRSATFRPNRAFVQCMRNHGLRNFNPNLSMDVTVQLTGKSHVARSYHACKHLLSVRSGTA